MQFSVINNTLNNIGVFYSNLDYDSKQLNNMINPGEILKKVAYDHFWHSRENDEWVNHINYTMKPYLHYNGFAKPSNKVDIYNINHVPEYLYVFYVQKDDKKVSLRYYKVQAKYYFTLYNTSAIYQYNITINDGHDGKSYHHDVTGTNDNGTLTVDYYGYSLPLNYQSVDWLPLVQEYKDNHSWQFPLILLVFVLLIIVAIIITAAVFAKPALEYVKHVTNEISNNYQEPEVRLT